MSAAAARARVAQSFSDLLDAEGATAIALEIGSDRSTPRRRGSDLAAWTAADLITLAIAHPSVGDAVVSAIQGDLQSGQAQDVERELRAIARESAAEIAALLARLEDGHIDRGEARETEAELAALETHIAKARSEIRARLKQGARS